MSYNFCGLKSEVGLGISGHQRQSLPTSVVKNYAKGKKNTYKPKGMTMHTPGSLRYMALFPSILFDAR